jgi:hypothetical protein
MTACRLNLTRCEFLSGATILLPVVLGSSWRRRQPHGSLSGTALSQFWVVPGRNLFLMLMF